MSFSPAVSDKAKKAIRQSIKQWRIHLWSGASLESIANEINPTVAGWINYCGKFGRWELKRSLQQIDEYLIRWAKAKYKRLRGKQIRAAEAIKKASQNCTWLFAHWRAGFAR